MVKKLLLLGLMLALAFILRFYKVTSSPPSLNWDEVSIGYNAYSILKTGRDEWGKSFPLHFQSYGEYKLPVQIYASIPAIAVLGLNPLGVRITSVIYGTLTVLLLYLLTQELFKNRLLSLIASLLLAVSPWHIQLTRASFESSFSVFWVLLGLWLFVKGVNGKKYWWLVSMVPFAISVYTYNSARVFTPLFLLAVGLIFRRYFQKSITYCLVASALFITLLLPLIPFVLSGEATARYKLVSITNEGGLIPRIDERRNLSTLPAPLPRLIHNRVTYISFYFIRNYLAHFTPNFLFIAGAPHVQHHVQKLGELYYFQAPFLLLGLYLLLTKKEKYRWLIIAWLLIAFVPVATTQDSIPNALRTVIAAPVYQILTAYGLVAALAYLNNNKMKKNLLIIGLLAVGLLEVGHYLRICYLQYPVLYSRDWQYGNKEAVSFIKEHYSNYDLVVYSRKYGEPHMFTLFYLNFPPEKYFTDPTLVRYKAYDWVWVTRFDKFYFPNLGDEGTRAEDIIGENPGKKILFIGSSDQIPNNLNLLKTINFLNGQPAFKIADTVLK